MRRPRTIFTELQCTKQGSRAIFDIFGLPPANFGRKQNFVAQVGGRGLQVIDPELFENEDRNITSSLLDDVTVHSKQNFYYKCIGHQWKSYIFVVVLQVIDSALSETNVKMITSSILDDVTVHSKLNFNYKCIGQQWKSFIFVIGLQVIDSALSESDVRMIASSLPDDGITDSIDFLT